MDTKLLCFDGSNLGDVDAYLISKLSGKNGIEKITIKTQNTKLPPLILRVYRYNREIPLILDEIKHKFNIYRTKYHLLNIEGNKYIGHLCFNEITLDEYIIDTKNKVWNVSLKYEIQKIFAFNWIMCVTANSDNRIYVRGLNPLEPDTKNASVVYPFTCNERAYSYDITSCDISEKMIERWFDGSRELFYTLIKKMMERINSIDEFKSDFEIVVKKYNTSLNSWVNIVYNRMMSVQYLTTD